MTAPEKHEIFRIMKHTHKGLVTCAEEASDDGAELQSAGSGLVVQDCLFLSHPKPPASQPSVSQDQTGRRRSQKLSAPSLAVSEAFSSFARMLRSAYLCVA